MGVLLWSHLLGQLLALPQEVAQLKLKMVYANSSALVQFFHKQPMEQPLSAEQEEGKQGKVYNFKCFGFKHNGYDK